MTDKCSDMFFKVKVVTRYADITIGNILITFLQMFITLISVVDVKDWLFCLNQTQTEYSIQFWAVYFQRCSNEVRLFLRAEWVGWYECENHVSKGSIEKTRKCFSSENCSRYKKVITKRNIDLLCMISEWKPISSEWIRFQVLGKGERSSDQKDPERLLGGGRIWVYILKNEKDLREIYGGRGIPKRGGGAWTMAEKRESKSLLEK